MPTISVNKKELYRRLEREYSTKEFDELCFDFGIELDEDTTEEVAALKKKGLPGGDEEPALKIEIPANRYDLLCMEGLARGLRMFLKLEQPPIYKVSTPSTYQEVKVEASVQAIRPFFASAILHMKEPFTPLTYASFIDLQDKLHQNLCRGRKLVAIGTHDLDTIKGPFRYMAKPPRDIKFAPLNKDQEYTAEELMPLYETDRHLSRYLPIIRDAPAYPIIYDSEDRVLSMPPIINSQHSKITLQTRNIFLDVTATDATKLDIVINILCTMFSEYTSTPFEVEPVKITFPDGTSRLTPDLTSRPTTASISYINAALGLALQPAEISTLLGQMSLRATPSAQHGSDVLAVEVPPTRSDVLHECDIMEDVGIAYGFNRLPTSLPKTNTVARPFPINKLGDVLRKESAQAGWVEVLPLILCSHDENYAYLNRADDNQAVRLLNPATAEFQVVRTSLLPGLLKTLRENKSLPLPLKLFEVSDIAVKDDREERRSRNYRRMAALYCDKKGGFEVVHGLLDRMMQILEIPFIGGPSGKSAEFGYYIKESEDPTFFPGRSASIYLRTTATISTSTTYQNAKTHASALDTIAQTLSSVLPSTGESATTKTSASTPKDVRIGSLGILHPAVLGKFSLVNPCSALEFDVEPFL